MRSLLVGLGAAALTFILSALAFALVDLYLMGHGRSSPMQQSFVSRGPVQLSVADAAALGLSVLLGVLTAARCVRGR